MIHTYMYIYIHIYVYIYIYTIYIKQAYIERMKKCMRTECEYTNVFETYMHM